MTKEFKFPDVGEGITEGEIVKWHVKEGDRIKEDEVFAEVETDKAVVEVPSPYSGVVLKLHGEEGDIINVGETIITVGEDGEAVEEKPGEKPPEKPPSKVAVVGELEEAPEEEEERPEILATPAVRKLAQEIKVDLSKVKGTGKKGRITKEDVEKAAAGEKKVEVKVTRKYDMFGHIKRVPMRGIRRATAKKMTEAWEKAPMVTHMDEADITHLVEVRGKYKKQAEEKGVKLTFLPFIVKAVVSALKEHPYLGSMIDEETNEIVLKEYYNIGIAVDTEEGLIVPVVKGCDQKSILQIAEEIENLVNKARERKIDLMDLKGGTFTITNIGVIGGTYATPILNFPEVAILGVGKIRDAPVVKDGEIVVRKNLSLSLTFDHRVVDGAEAARFMNDVIKRLADPDLLIVE
ncbi:MAG: dihydrolipoamide acetyltransferase family protein [Candidatus Hydrothermarchaeaceae archaeon]